ncbi:MAG: peptidase U32 family protein [Candidatus Woesearchaeota archaeon]|jgi:putative protease
MISKSKNTSQKIELTAPVGSWESLAAAIKAGADSVYFGVGKLNMRSRSAINFQIKDLKKIKTICVKNHINAYLALNIVVYDDELRETKKIIDSAKKANIDAIIASDISIIEYAKKIKIPVHISTQANVSNLEAVRFFSKYADCIVLARELNLSQIKNICDTIKKEKIRGPSGELVKIEIFAHGALCVAIAGKCHMSLATYNHSANRGDCLQTCRRKYRVIDEETNQELIIDNQFVMSPKDLCTINVLDKIINAGPTILKIEGRGRSPDYVYTTIRAYKDALNLIEENNFTEDKKKELQTQLDSVFNRGFWQGGYYLGEKLGVWSGIYGSAATKNKTFLGAIQNYYSKKGVCSVFIETGLIKKGDEILITGTTTGVVQFIVNAIVLDEKNVEIAKKNDFIAFMVPQKVRKNDKVYVLKAK